MPKLDLNEKTMSEGRKNRWAAMEGSLAFKHECWGEVKTLKEWLIDSRNRCPRLITLQQRICAGWPIERALTEIPKTQKREVEPKRIARSTKMVKVTAWGVSKTMVEWSEMEFCPVSYVSLWRRIVKWGWKPEDAIMTPPWGAPHGIKLDYEGKTLGELISESARVRGEILKQRIHNDYSDRMKRAGIIKGLMTVIKKDADKIELLLRSRLGMCKLIWDANNFPEAKEGDEYKIAISRTKRGRKLSDDEIVRAKMIEEKERKHAEKDKTNDFD